MLIIIPAMRCDDPQGLVAGRGQGITGSLRNQVIGEVRELESCGKLRMTPPAPTGEQTARLLQNERLAR
jgi:hypothetical protein